MPTIAQDSVAYNNIDTDRTKVSSCYAKIAVTNIYSENIMYIFDGVLSKHLKLFIICTSTEMNINMPPFIRIW